MFGVKKRTALRMEELCEFLPPQKKAVYTDENPLRPCWVKGRKAIFHRWCNTANPALPRGMEPTDEKARYFQYRSVQAIVEFMDGTVERVWPQEIEFADGGLFDEMTWLPRNQPEGQ